MGDAIYDIIAAAYGEAEGVRSVFNAVTRVQGGEEGTVSARFAASDGGAWVLQVSGSSPSSVEVMFCIGDGGLPGGFADDLSAFCFEIDLSAPDSLKPALLKLLTKAATLYVKMNNLNWREMGKIGEPSRGGSGPAAQVSSAAAEAGGGGAQQQRDDLERLPSRRRSAFGRGTYKIPDFEPTPLATASLTKQLQLLSRIDTNSMGFSAEPVDDNLYMWRAELYFTDMSTRLARDLKGHPTMSHVELEFRFPGAYPYEPPFCRVVAPRFARCTGFVQSGGGLCMELLTGSGWSPVSAMDSTILSIHSFLTAGNGCLDLSDVCPSGKCSRYTFEGALKDMAGVVASHGWNARNVPNPHAQKRPRSEDEDIEKASKK